MFALSVDYRMEEGRPGRSAEPVLNQPRYQKQDPASKRTIALLIASLSGGEAPRRALALAHAFAVRGHRVDLVIVRPDDPFAENSYPAYALWRSNPGFSACPSSEIFVASRWWRPLRRYSTAHPSADSCECERTSMTPIVRQSVISMCSSVSITPSAPAFAGRPNDRGATRLEA